MDIIIILELVNSSRKKPPPLVITGQVFKIYRTSTLLNFIPESLEGHPPISRHSYHPRSCHQHHTSCGGFLRQLECHRICSHLGMLGAGSVAYTRLRNCAKN